MDRLRNLYNGRQGDGSLHRLLTTLHSAKLPDLHKLFNEFDQLIVANRAQCFGSIVLDLCCERLFFPVCMGTNSTAKTLCRFIKVFFYNKGIGKIKLTTILHNKLVRSKVPIYFQKQDPPLVSNISRSVFNYNQTLRNINSASSSYALRSHVKKHQPPEWPVHSRLCSTRSAKD